MGVPAFGGGGFAFRQPPDPPEPAVPQVAGTALNGTATYTKGNELPGQNGTDVTYDDTTGTSQTDAVNGAASDTVASRFTLGEDLPEDILVGPTPAFQASVLEVELDLRNALAEIAAKRSQTTDEAAIAPATSTPTTTGADRASVQARDLAQDTQTALTATPSEAQDPEARHSGPAAVLRTPYDG
jgi:hypothetical protein